MHETASPSVPGGLRAFEQWNPDAQRKAADLLEQYEARSWKPFYCPNPTCDGRPHGKDWNFEHARADQRPPPWNATNWLTWLIRSGRGAGKTYTGANAVNRITQVVPRIALIGPTGPDLRETMVEGPSGILATAKPGQMPEWNPSRKRLVWPNGCIAQGFSGEEPDRIRGGNNGAAWIDEPAHIDLIEEVWNQLLLTLRVKEANPHIIATTTPKPIKWMKNLIADPLTIDVRVSTYANLHNLSPVFRRTILDSFEGTRFGKQELHGEVLEDVEGALWKPSFITSISEDKVPDLERVVVALDPAGSANIRSDETGIIVLGLSGRNIYVLADFTGKYSPAGWAKRALDAAEEFHADAIVAEKNYGGDMVRNTIEKEAEAYAVPPRVVLVDSRRGKQLRAEPIVALYEKKRVLHVTGENRADLLELEEEQCSWVPGQGASPNRVDALVHGVTDLARAQMPVVLADRSLLGGRQASTPRFRRY